MSSKKKKRAKKKGQDCEKTVGAELVQLIASQLDPMTQGFRLVFQRPDGSTFTDVVSQSVLVAATNPDMGLLHDPGHHASGLVINHGARVDWPVREGGPELEEPEDLELLVRFPRSSGKGADQFAAVVARRLQVVFGEGVETFINAYAGREDEEPEWFKVTPDEGI